MKIMKKLFYLSILMLIPFTCIQAQECAFEDFIGTWHGYISSQSLGGYNDPMTMII